MRCAVAVYGTRYLGATHAAAMAELGHQVVGADVDEDKLRKLASGEAPLYEPRLGELLKANVDAGQLGSRPHIRRRRSRPTSTS